MPMRDKVCERLISFGYTLIDTDVTDGGIIYHPSPVDEMMIKFSIDKVTQHITSECNTDSIPSEIENKVIDNIVGEFLLMKKSLGQLAIGDVDFSMVYKSIEEGDTTVSFADGCSPADMFDVLLNYLLKPIDLSNFRRIIW